MSRELNFFFPDAAEAKRTHVEIVASNRFKNEDGEPIAWVFRLFDVAEIADIKKSAAKAINRNGQKSVSVDMQLLNERAILGSVEYPNLKDKTLQDAYGVLSDRELLLKMLEGRELERLGDKVIRAQGFIEDINAMIDDAKN